MRARVPGAFWVFWIFLCNDPRLLNSDRAVLYGYDCLCHRISMLLDFFLSVIVVRNSQGDLKGSFVS
jgi:hypothetical protein